MDDFLASIFSKSGPLVKSLKGFEERAGQQEMAKQILQAYEENEVALIEAGTGTGKSLAYLIPAILWALKYKEKTVISTYTIALQEQLLHKDIPMLLKILDVDIKPILIKGMSNYVCLRKLGEVEEEREIIPIKAWAGKTKEGSQSDISFPVTATTWDKVNADSQNCSHVLCPHYKSCFFFKARRQAEDAQLLIVNHHILFADMAAKKRTDYKEEKAIIPPYQRIVIDEAHHIEEVALDSLSKRFDRLNLVRLLGRLYSDLHPERSRLMILRSALTEARSGLISRLEIDLPAEKRSLVEKIESAFSALENFCRNSFSMDAKEQRWRLREEHFKLPGLLNDVKPLYNELSGSLKRFAQSVLAVKEEVEKTHPQIAIELQSIAVRIEEQAQGLEDFFISQENASRVRWVEAGLVNLTMVDAELDISSYLKEELFEELATLALCSATLSCAGKFDHLRARLGITTDKPVSEKIYESPFDYASHALLAVPTDLPDPTDYSFTQKASEVILQAIEASRGGAFVLFTSYEMLRASYNQLQAEGEKQGFTFLKQGDAPRQQLIEKFKMQKRCVLFGTDSFWEGVDIAGDALRLVILVKLPFRVPTDPLMQALCESMELEGKNPFMEYQVPQAVMKFKQGFGRLIRTKTDKGCILSLDKRLITKQYGKLFLQSLPSCKTIFGSTQEVMKEIKAMLER